MKINEINLTGAQTLADLKGLLLAALAGIVMALMIGTLMMAALLLTPA